MYRDKCILYTAVRCYSVIYISISYRSISNKTKQGIAKNNIGIIQWITQTALFNHANTRYRPRISPSQTGGLESNQLSAILYPTIVCAPLLDYPAGDFRFLYLIGSYPKKSLIFPV